MPPHLNTLRLQASALPQAPGVYFWLDGAGRILYIGKAVNLRSRVTSYFSSARRDRRVREMLDSAREIHFQVTNTELEALFRESALIKREQPPYNRLLRSARRAYYLKLDRTVRDPFLELTHDNPDDQAEYYGPFASGAIARETMAYLHDVLPIRKCQAAKPRCRPCLYFQMGKCAAPLLDAEHRRMHDDALERLGDLLDGRSDRVAAWLETKRNRLSESLLFERAAEMQARLEALSDQRRQLAILEAATRSRCVLIRDEDQRDGARVLLVARGHVLAMRNVSTLSAVELAHWVVLHDPVMRAVTREQGELDAADILARWIRSRKQRVRWVAVPNLGDSAALFDRAQYVLRDA